MGRRVRSTLGLELPQGDDHGDATLALGLQLVHHPCVLEGALGEVEGQEGRDGTFIIRFKEASGLH